MCLSWNRLVCGERCEVCGAGTCNVLSGSQLLVYIYLSRPFSKSVSTFFKISIKTHIKHHTLIHPGL